MLCRGWANSYGRCGRMARGASSAILSEDPFERLLDELLKADEWLSNLPGPNNRHSFSVGAFVGSEPVFALVSNFQEPSGLARDIASAPSLLVPVASLQTGTFVSGRKALSPEPRAAASLPSLRATRRPTTCTLQRQKRTGSSRRTRALSALLVSLRT